MAYKLKKRKPDTAGKNITLLPQGTTISSGKVTDFFTDVVMLNIYSAIYKDPCGRDGPLDLKQYEDFCKGFTEGYSYLQNIVEMHLNGLRESVGLKK